ncbi:DUF7503 family protein [Halostagnicola larsenii]|nr:hypothetical protein [Halostagnicola larsenii]
MSATESMKDFLASHPRMLGALFTLVLLLGQAGTVAAGTHTQVGP